MRKEIRHIFDRLISECNFSILNSNEKDTAYKLVPDKNLEIRISNHRAKIKDDNRELISIVFQENDDECYKLDNIDEIVYDLKGNLYLSDYQIDKIRDIINLMSEENK